MKVMNTCPHLCHRRIQRILKLSERLCHSRMQRDLSDSTVVRNVGVALAHSHLAWQETLAGLGRIELDAAACRAELEREPQLLAEPYLEEALRARLRALDVAGYVGLAPRVCREARAAAELELAP